MASGLVVHHVPWRQRWAGLRRRRWPRATGAYQARSHVLVLSHSVGIQASGIRPRFFAHVWKTGATENLDARHINAALWSATRGYFLEQMMAETFSDEAIRAARRHFIDFVRARGPFPTKRSLITWFTVDSSICAWLSERAGQRQYPLRGPLQRTEPRGQDDLLTKDRR